MNKLPLNQILCGDCVEVMQGFPENSIDLVVTSPPYWGLRDYGEETVQVWGSDPECEHEWGETLPKGGRTKRLKDGDPKQSKEGISEGFALADGGNFCSKCGAWRGSLGLEPHPQLFIEHLVEICREIKRVMKPTGTFWLNLGDTYFGGSGWKRDKNQTTKLEGGLQVHGPLRYEKKESNWLQPKQKLMIPSRVAIALQHDGWILRNDICWFKPNHMPSSVRDRLTSAYEHIFLFAKQRRYYFDLDAIRIPHAPSGLERAKYPLSDWRGVEKTKTKIGRVIDGGWLQTKENPDKKILKLNPKGKNPGDIWETDAPNTGARNKPPYKQNNPHLARLTDGREAGHPKGKNPGDLWRIPTMPFPGAHFATFPPKLIEPIIKAGSPRWICSKCGKPRERIIEKRGYVEHPQREGRNVKAVQFSKEENKYVSGGTLGLISQEKTVGWSDCGCGADWVGGVVLDPFAGSGTALRVARRLGRRFIGIEINQKYAEMCEIRLRADTYKPPPEGVKPLTEIFENE